MSVSIGSLIGIRYLSDRDLFRWRTDYTIPELETFHQILTIEKKNFQKVLEFI